MSSPASSPSVALFAPPAPPPYAPVRLGTPWIVAVIICILALIFFASLAYWVMKRKELRVPDSTAAAGTVCGLQRKHVAGLLCIRAAVLLWLLIFSLRDRIADAQRAGIPPAAGSMARNFYPTHMGWPPSYTAWCFRLQPFYYAFACGASVAHLAGRDLPRLRACQWGLLQICVPSSWLVFLVVFFMLDPLDPSIVYNRAAPAHFWNTAALTLEDNLC